MWMGCVGCLMRDSAGVCVCGMARTGWVDWCRSERDERSMRSDEGGGDGRGEVARGAAVVVVFVCGI